MSTFSAQPTAPSRSRHYIVAHESDCMTREYLCIPDTMKSWPWRRKINPHREPAAAECAAWLNGLRSLSPRSCRAYDMADCNLLCALAYPAVSLEHLRIAMDMMAVTFVIKESTDVESAVEIAIDALRQPDKPRPEGEFVLGELTRQFWARAWAIADPRTAEHFVNLFIDYLKTIIAQAGDRGNRTELSVRGYLARRRESVGGRPSFVLGVLHLSIPDEAFNHPVIKELENAILDLIIVDNDIVSYNKEQATGENDDAYNILTVAMRHFEADFDSAMNWIIKYHKDVQSRFIYNLARVPVFGPTVDGAIQEYIAHLANWPRANICWSFEGGRFFGAKGLQVQETRMAPLFSNCVPNVNVELRRELVEELERAFGGANEDVLVGSIGGQE